MPLPKFAENSQKRPLCSSAGNLAKLGIVFGIGLLMSGCLESSNNSASDKFTTSWVRPENPQEQIGAREHPIVVAKYGGEYRNRKTERMLAIIVGQLVAVSNDPSRIYRVTLLNSPKVNAFALPGGYLYVTRGLLAVANDSSEIAAVIAHEMAHVAANHAILRQEKLASTKVGEQVVTQVLGDSNSAKIALAANRIKLSEFSREQEIQADAVGIRMTGKAGYDPYAGARFLETLQAYKLFKIGGLSIFADANFLSTHPATPRRTTLARNHARFFGAPGVGKRDRDRYLAGIEGLTFGDTADEGFVRGRTFSHTGLGITFQVPSEHRIENQTRAVVISGPGDVAVRFDATVIERNANLRDYMKSGWVNGLDKSSIKLRTINGLKTASADAKADGWNFKIHVVRIGSQLYRFIAAASQNTVALATLSDAIANSFRNMSESERKNLAPLKIRIVKFENGSTLDSIASKMKSGGNSVKLLRVLNDLAPGQIPAVGTKLKIVAD